MSIESNAYILGTYDDELYRLGLQHQVWASEAQRGWRTAGFTAGMHLLDLGCGPGFCTKELGFIAGPTGSVTGVDRSAHYIHYLEEVSRLHGLNIDGLLADFDQMELEANHYDGMYCRWAMAWIDNPQEILTKVYRALKPGGKMVLHEYYDWSTHQTEPVMPHLSQAIAACLKSFKTPPGDIDIGRHLPTLLSDIGMKVSSKRLMSKIATPQSIEWHWPKSFYLTYFPRLVEMGYLDQETMDGTLRDLDQLEQSDNSTLFCPILIEVIAEKPISTL